ncbi:MAG: dihydropteroate synthase [Verrucomicrobiota bacterium]
MLTLEHLAALQRAYSEATQAQVKEFALGDRALSFNARPAIMGVINLSPDSWYRESVVLSTDRAVQRGRVLAAQGADIIDLGAESTLPNAARLESARQLAKLRPVIRELAAAGLAVSVETYDSAVAEAALAAGARVLNLTGLRESAAIFERAAEADAAVILCYVQGKSVREVGRFKFAADPVGAMHDYFERAIDSAMRQGVSKLFIDPGLGFYYRNLLDSAVRVRFQMEVFLNAFRLRSLGFPICQALPHAFEYFGEEVRCAEPFFAVLAALGKTDLFRTHEVARTKAVLDTLAVYQPRS